MYEFFRSRYFYSELHYSKPWRISVGRYGIQVTTGTKVFALSFKPIQF